MDKTTNVSKERMDLPEGLEQVNLNAAGIDIGSRQHYVSVPPGRTEHSVQSFDSYTEDLYRLAAWLKDCRVETVVMESTGVYWIALYQILEARGFEVLLVNARDIKNVKGRKSDVADCQWLQQLHTYGLLSGCFRPEAEICVLRSYMRQRQMLVESKSQHVQHMQKALVQMNIQLTQVISDISGTSGMAIIRAILAGERDREKLAELKDYRLHSTVKEIAKALEGDWREEHLFALGQAVASYDFTQQQIAECDHRIVGLLEQMEGRIDPDEHPLEEGRNQKRRRGGIGKDEAENLRRVLYRASGVDLTAINGLDIQSVQVLLSEIGLDMSRWPTEKHFSSWLGLSPNTAKSGGRVLTRRPRKVVNRAAQMLRMAAYGLQRSTSALGAYYRSMKGRLGPSKAVKATAHRLACLVYRALRYGTKYVDIGQQAFEQQAAKRRLASLTRAAHKLGLTLVPAVS